MQPALGIGRISGNEEVGVNHLDILRLFVFTTTTTVGFDTKDIHYSFDSFPIEI